MSICGYCQKEMTSPTTNTCTEHHVTFINQPNEHHARVSYPLQDEGGNTNRRCHDCNVIAGGTHHPGCDMEICPICKGQLISCGCLGGPDWDEFNAPPVEDGGQVSLEETDAAIPYLHKWPHIEELEGKRTDYQEGYKIGVGIGEGIGIAAAFEVMSAHFGKPDPLTGKWTDGKLWEEFETINPSMRANGLSPISTWYTIAQKIAQDYEALASKVEALKNTLKDKTG